MPTQLVTLRLESAGKESGLHCIGSHVGATPEKLPFAKQVKTDSAVTKPVGQRTKQKDSSAVLLQSLMSKPSGRDVVGHVAGEQESAGPVKIPENVQLYGAGPPSKPVSQVTEQVSPETLPEQSPATTPGPEGRPPLQGTTGGAVVVSPSVGEFGFTVREVAVEDVVVDVDDKVDVRVEDQVDDVIVDDKVADVIVDDKVVDVIVDDKVVDVIVEDKVVDVEDALVVVELLCVDDVVDVLVLLLELCVEEVVDVLVLLLDDVVVAELLCVDDVVDTLLLEVAVVDVVVLLVDDVDVDEVVLTEIVLLLVVAVVLELDEAVVLVVV